MTAISTPSARRICFSGDPLDMEEIAVWEEENGVPWDPDSEGHDKEPVTAALRPANTGAFPGTAVGYWHR